MGGLQSIAPRFYAVADVPYGGLLLALPALLSMGLLSKINEHFILPPGYYSLQSLFLLLAFVAMARMKTLEDLRYTAPGEWGKLLGLDRVPEVRTLRQKVLLLSQSDRPAKWGEHLSQEWIKTEASTEGIFYIDGHVRVYHGEQTPLPRHYVTREKLCLRATVDYWVNALGGAPFFFINQPVDPGLIESLKTHIIPRLEEALPVVDEVTQKSYEHRFTLIFDREGYSPDLMKYCLQKKIACITYRKYVKEVWEENEFVAKTISRFAGNTQTVLLAERGVQLSNKQ